MPLYEYQCESCGRFEVIQKFAEQPLKTCPTCKRPVQKLLSAPAIQFKGTGWYVTDYARKGSGGEAKGGESGSKASDKPAEKPAATGSNSSGGSDATGGGTSSK